MSDRPVKDASSQGPPATRSGNDKSGGKHVTSARIEADLATFYQAGGHIEVLGAPSSGKEATPHSAPARARSNRRGSSP